MDKKIQRKDHRITQLERNMREAKQKYEKLLAQSAKVISAVDSAAIPRMGKTPSEVRKANIMRPIKGGVPSARPDGEVAGGYPVADASPVSDSPPRPRESSRTRLTGMKV